MLFALCGIDKKDAVQTRLANYEAHKAYLKDTAPVRTIISGPLLGDDNQTMVGSLFVLEAPSLADVEKFHANDPFKHAGIYEKVIIRPFNMRVDNRS